MKQLAHMYCHIEIVENACCHLLYLSTNQNHMTIIGLMYFFSGSIHKFSWDSIAYSGWARPTDNPNIDIIDGYVAFISQVTKYVQHTCCRINARVSTKFRNNVCYYLFICSFIYVRIQCTPYMALNIRVDYGNVIRLNVYPVFIHKMCQTPVALTK